MISERISDNIPSQTNILNMAIPILMHFFSFELKLERCKPHKAAPHPSNCDAINDFKLFPTLCLLSYRRYANVIYIVTRCS